MECCQSLEYYSRRETNCIILFPCYVKSLTDILLDRKHFGKSHLKFFNKRSA